MLRYCEFGSVGLRNAWVKFFMSGSDFRKLLFGGTLVALNRVECLSFYVPLGGFWSLVVVFPFGQPPWAGLKWRGTFFGHETDKTMPANPTFRLVNLICITAHKIPKPTFQA